MTTTQLAEQAMQPLKKQVEALRLRGELRPPADKVKDLHGELRRLETQIDDISMLYSDLRQRKALVVREIMLLMEK